MKLLNRIVVLICIVCVTLILTLVYSMNELNETNRASVYLEMSDKAYHNIVAEHLKQIGDVAQTDREVYSMISKLCSMNKDFFPKSFWTLSSEGLRVSNQRNVNHRTASARLPFFTYSKGTANSPYWYQFYSNIRQYSLYDPDDPAVDGVLRDMSTLPITDVDEITTGTQLKMLVTFKNGGRALLKPMRYSRNGSAHNHAQEPYERHFAEIAAFHLDRILGIYRVPPAVGRRVNIETELKHLVPFTIRRTFITDEDGRICFHGNCLQGCHRQSAFCGTPDSLEVALMLYLPTTPLARFADGVHPWRNEIHGKIRSDWVSYQFVCNKTRRKFHAGHTYLAESLDVQYLDMLIDNGDRHHIAFFKDFENQTAPLMVDNGRGFGNPANEYKVYLLTRPENKCCLIKKSTFLNFLKVFLGPDKLSSLMRTSLKSDPVSPVLMEDQLAALDRRFSPSASALSQPLTLLESSLRSHRWNRQTANIHDSVGAQVASGSERELGQGDTHSWRSLQRHYLHPHYSSSILDETINRPNNAIQSAINRAIAGAFMGTGEAAVANNIINQTYRIQHWDFRKCDIPDITSSTENVLVPHCKLHNSASCDISLDCSLLATFVPSHQGFPDDNILTVYSLRPESRGQCLFTKRFGPNAIYISISPKNNHVLVGLAAKRLSWVFTSDQLVAQVYRLEKEGAGERSMKHVKDVMHSCNMGIRSHVSGNSARWLPRPGQGIVYGTNRGDLHLCRPGVKVVVEKTNKPDGQRSSDLTDSTGNIRRCLLGRVPWLNYANPDRISTSTQTHGIRRTTSTQTEQEEQDNVVWL